MEDAYIGELRAFAGNFEPRNFLFCHGQLLSIAANTALFSIIGTTYGGDGKTTFALPDLRGRTAIGSGTGPGLTTYSIGARSGYETNTLNQLNLPPHNHTAQGTIYASTENGSTNDPSAGVPAKSVYPKDRSTNEAVNSYTQNGNVKMAANGVEISVNNTGGGQPVNNMQPFLAVNWIICVQGLFPSRS